MKHAFEIVPILVAAAIGIAIFTAMNPQQPGTSNITNGALIGAGVQIGVRLFGVS
jgi:hypothetical protein